MREAEPGRPWLSLYGSGVPTELPSPPATLIDDLERHAQGRPEAAALRYFEEPMNYRRLDDLAGRFATLLAQWGVGKGDRVALRLQNDPAFPIALLGAWKRGAIGVPLNPMFKSDELAYHLNDCGARILVALESLFGDHERAALGASVERVVTTHERDFLPVHLPLPFPLSQSAPKATPAGATDLVTALNATAPCARAREQVSLDDVACLVYTSGTTGPSKGSISRHRHLAYNAAVYRAWMQLGPSDSVLGIAPLFHITGLVGHLGVAIAAGIPLVISHRFDAAELLRLTERLRPTMTVASITAFLAFLNVPGAEGRDIRSLTRCFSGGAPVPPGVVERFEKAYSVRIHNIYGLTESNSPTHAVPLGAQAPVDPASGALSIGVPVPGLDARVLDLDGSGREVAAGEPGELAVKGPMICAGYWNMPKETETAFRDGYFLTGDVVVMNPKGWFFVVDRKKDVIICSGFKVWPREVEDVLYRHPGVREAAVVGVPDAYRGEAVKAFVALVAGASTDSADLLRFCRERLAAYKCPGEVEIVPVVPKTASGKVLRRALRAPNLATVADEA